MLLYFTNIVTRRIFTGRPVQGVPAMVVERAEEYLTMLSLYPGQVPIQHTEGRPVEVQIGTQMSFPFDRCRLPIDSRWGVDYFPGMDDYVQYIGLENGMEPLGPVDVVEVNDAPLTGRPIWDTVHPGRILKHLFLDPRGIVEAQAADALGISKRHLVSLIRGRRGINTEMSIRLSICLGTEEDLWTRLQSHYETTLLYRTGAVDDIWSSIRKLPRR